jgi:serine/threonine-protein kinase
MDVTSPSPNIEAAEPVDARACLERVLASPGFASAPRRAKLLRYLVEAARDPAAKPVTEYAIGLDVYDRPSSFDPRLDSIVRTELSRLRQKLKDYYAGEGRADPISIEIPPRSYVPIFTPRTAQNTPAGNSPLAGGWPQNVLRFGIPLLIGVIAATGILFAGRFWKSPPPAAPALSAVVVLPFQNLSPSANQEYLADGVTEELTNELAQRKDLRVVARTSAFQFKGQGIDIRTVGQKLNVGAALEGSVAEEADRVRITAQLNRTSDGYHLWSRSFEVARPDLMLAESEVAQGVIANLGLPGSPLQQAGSTKNPEAHELFLQARYQLSLNTPQSYRTSLDLFRSAVAKDPSYVSAYIGIAQAEIDVIHLTAGAPKEGLEQARNALTEAIALDPASADAHGMMGYLAYTYDWDWPRAEREYRVALAEGAQAPVHSFYGAALASHGQFSEAHEQLALAEDIDPLGMAPRFNEMFAYYLEHRYGDAKSMLKTMLQMHPDLLSAQLLLGLIATVEHDCNEADAHFGWAASKYQMPVTKFGLAAVAACRNENDLARRDLEEAAASKGPDFVSPYQLALGYALLHDKEAALSWLTKSADAREGQIMYLRYEPIFDDIRGDPRYLALEKRVGLM